MDVAGGVTESLTGAGDSGRKTPWRLALSWFVSSYGERRFVIAHELLHAGLRHDTRGGGRDPWLWNVACDYVINGWLAEMDVGDRPDCARSRRLRHPARAAGPAR